MCLHVDICIRKKSTEIFVQINSFLGIGFVVMDVKGRDCIVMQHVVSHLILTASPALSKIIRLHSICTKIHLDSFTSLIFNTNIEQNNHLPRFFLFHFSISQCHRSQAVLSAQ